MPSAQHLGILLEGQERWNLWRQNAKDKEYPVLHWSDLQERCLDTFDFSKANLLGANFVGSSLLKASFDEGDLRAAKFAKTNLAGARFRGSDCTGADFSDACLAHADLQDACFIGANLQNADLSHTDLANADFEGANLSGAIFNRANLSGASFQGAILTGAVLCGTQINESTVQDADLRGADLRNVHFVDVTFVGTDLSDGTLGGTVFANCDLKDVSGLASVSHDSPSILGVDTLYRTAVPLPDLFLSGFGIPPEFVHGLLDEEGTLSCAGTSQGAEQTNQELNEGIFNTTSEPEDRGARAHGAAMSAIASGAAPGESEEEQDYCIPLSTIPVSGGGRSEGLLNADDNQAQRTDQPPEESGGHATQWSQRSSPN